MSLILAEQSRQLVRDLTIQDSAGSTITPGANDVVRVKIGRRGSAPILDLDSAAASDNGSTFAKNSPTSGKSRLTIAAADMALLEPGVYSFEFGLYDNAAGGMKHVDHQVMVVQGVMAGDVGAS